MKWTPGGESQDIEDRRDEGGGGGGGFQFGGMHLGIGGALILLVLNTGAEIRRALAVLRTRRSPGSQIPRAINGNNR